jgi:hypothetical protein
LTKLIFLKAEWVVDCKNYSIVQKYIITTVKYIFNFRNYKVCLRIKNVFNQGNQCDAIGFDLAETFTTPALECSDNVSINI